MNITKKNLTILFTSLILGAFASVNVFGSGGDSNEQQDVSSDIRESLVPLIIDEVSKPELTLTPAIDESEYICTPRTDAEHSEWAKDFSAYSLVWVDSQNKCSGEDKVRQKDCADDGISRETCVDNECEKEELLCSSAACEPICEPKNAQSAIAPIKIFDEKKYDFSDEILMIVNKTFSSY